MAHLLQMTQGTNASVAGRDVIPRRRPVRGAAGVTFIELLAVMMVAGIITAVILGTWQRLSWYIYRQEARGQLRADTDRIANVLSEELRRSREVLSMSDNEIVFVATKTGDTIAYRLDWDGVLMRNDTPVHIAVRDALVEEFTVETTDSDPFSTAGEVGLVRISLQLTDTARGNSSSADIEVAVQLPGDPFWNWGF